MKEWTVSSYSQWNHSLLLYLLEGLPRGSQVYLSIDNDVLKQVARDLPDLQRDAVEDFSAAIKSAVAHGDRVSLTLARGVNDEGEPMCLAFLSAMVLAATRMADELGDGDENEISAANYFRRLREVLGLPPSEGRPMGLEAGIEEPLWREWAQWLQERGYVASARRGEGPRKFIDYPISQAILRGIDKDRLCRLFSDKQWRTGWDQDTLVANVQREARWLTQHLQELLRSPGLRYAAVSDAIYDVYDAWQADPQMSHGRSDALQSTNIMSGLMRTADPFSGTIDYYIYARTPRRRRADFVEVQVGDNVQKLTPDRPGWFAPAFTVDASDLNNGRRYPVLAHDDLEWLVLPKRDFWVLVPDPENQEGDGFATWGTPSLGVPFMLLCRRELIPQLEHLRNERVLEWAGDPIPVLGSAEWVEVQYCMPVSESWSGIFIDNQSLFEALRPKAALSVSLSGGLRAPDMHGWLEAYGPQITVFGFEPTVDVQIKSVATDHAIFSEEQRSNAPFTYEWPHPGDYIIEADCGGEIATRLVKIVAWDEIESRQASPGPPTAGLLGRVNSTTTQDGDASDSEQSDSSTVTTTLEAVNLGAAKLTGAYLVER